MDIETAIDLLTKELSYYPYYYSVELLEDTGAVLFEFRRYDRVKIIVFPNGTLEVFPAIFIEGEWREIKTTINHTANHWLRWLFSH